jgi:hypothetical protein
MNPSRTDSELSMSTPAPLRAVIAGAYGSATVALLFLLLDTLRGDPLATPSLMGSVFLLGQAPSADLPVRLDMLALYSLVHFAIFTGLALGGTWFSARASRPARAGLAGVLMVTMSAGVIAVDALWAPGLLQLIGLVPLLVANVAASAVMAVFIVESRERRPQSELPTPLRPVVVTR